MKQTCSCVRDLCFEDTVNTPTYPIHNPDSDEQGLSTSYPRYAIGLI